MLPIVGAMQSLQGLLTTISGGLSSITGAISGLGGAFSSVFNTLGTIAAGPLGEIEDKITDAAGKLGDGFDKAKEKVGGVIGEVSGNLGDAVDDVKDAFFSIFDKKKVEEAIAPVSEFTTAQQVSDAGYADAIIRDKIKEEQVASAQVRNQQKADIAAMQNYAASRGAVNVTVNAGGITDRSDKKQMALEIGNEIQRELARYNAGLTRAPRL
tara:strand:+ start:909 stop:1544 length:636 start_codon:yes stop_codon:yes gene_type:complete